MPKGSTTSPKDTVAIISSAFAFTFFCLLPQGSRVLVSQPCTSCSFRSSRVLRIPTLRTRSNRLVIPNTRMPTTLEIVQRRL